MTDYSGYNVLTLLGPAHGFGISATHYQGLPFDAFDGGSPAIRVSKHGSLIDTPNRAVVNSAGVILQSISEPIYNTVSPLPAALNVGSVLTDTQYGFKLFNKFLHLAGVEIQSIVSTDNTITIEGPAATANIGRLTEANYVITIPGDGSDTIDFTITWAFTNGSSTVLQVTGVRTSIQTAVPEYPMTETMEFKTNITPTYSSEFRGSAREHPRVTATYNWILQGSELSRFYSTVRSGEKDHFSFPMWREALTCPAAVAGNTEIPYGTDDWDVQVNQSLFVHDYYSNDEVVTVISITSTTTTVSAFSQGHSRPYSIMPMVSGFLREAPTFNMMGEDLAYVNLTVESATFHKWSAPLIAEFTNNNWDLLGTDLVWPFPNVVLSGVDMSALTPRFFSDNDSGLVTATMESSKVREYFIIHHLMRNSLDIIQIKRFLYFVNGMLKSFYVPTNRPDIVVGTADMDSGSTILTEDKLNGVDGYAGEVRAIQFQFTDGTVHNAIATFTVGSQDVSFTPGLTRSVNVATELLQVCLMQRVRLDSDILSFTHEGPTRSIIKLPLVNII